MGKILRNGISYAGGGAEGKSAYQTWLDLGNEGTEQDFIDSLGGGGSSLYVVTGSLDMENEDNPVTLNQTYEEIKAAYDEGKTIVADILVAGEAQYIFNLLYILEDAIAFEWINSAAKIGGQINLMNDNTTTFTMTNLEGEPVEMPETFVITGNYAVDENDNWVVFNIDKTFAEINEAIIDNQDVVLKIYPEGDTTNPYILYPTMHYSNMGTAFSLAVCDEGQISGLSVMITADNQVVASRNEYDFSEFYKKTEADEKFAAKEDLNTMSATEQILTSTLGYTCKNLIPSPYGTNPSESRGVTFTPNADGSVNYSGIANDPTASFYTYPTVMYLPAGSYKVTGGDDIYGGAGVLLYDDKDCTVTYTGGYEGLLTISTTSVYIFNTLDGTVNWNKDTNPYGYEKEFTIDKPAYAKVQARGVNNTYTEEVSGIIYPMVRLASIEDATWETYKPNIDERFNTFLGGKEVKAINNQFGSTTKLFRITDAPSESGKGYTVKLVAQRKNATAHAEYLTVSRINDNYTFESSIELQEKNVSTGAPVTMENANFLIVDANHELWAHIPSYTYAYVELISPNAKGTFVIDGTEGEIAEDAVLETFDKRETDTFAKQGEIEALKKSVSDGKSAVAGAITAKGIDTAADAEFATIEENIFKIDTENPNLVMKQSNITGLSLSNSMAYGNGVFVSFYSTNNSKTLYYSKDGGATWKISSLDTSSATGSKITYASKYKLFIGRFTGLGLYTSYDGNTWTLRLSSSNVDDFYYDDVTGIAIAGLSSGGSGLWYTFNGYSWTVNGTYSGKKISNFRGAGGRLYATIDSGTYVSTNGSSWSVVSALSSYSISSLRYEQGLWMANISSLGAGNSWYYSSDGVTFTKTNSVSFSGTTYGVDFQDMKRVNGTTWIVSLYTGILYTTDSGKTWAFSNLGISTGRWTFFTHLDKIYAASVGGPGSSYGGVYYSTDGKTWTATTGISGGLGTCRAFHIQDKCVISAANNSATYYLNSNGTSWTQILSGECAIYGTDDILITDSCKYSFDGINWKTADRSALNSTTSYKCSYVYYCGGSLVMTPSSSSYGMAYAHILR